jgi:hypothetical protein
MFFAPSINPFENSREVRTSINCAPDFFINSENSTFETFLVIVCAVRVVEDVEHEKNKKTILKIKNIFIIIDLIVDEFSGLKIYTE